jgi:hypothetical protein
MGKDDWPALVHGNWQIAHFWVRKPYIDRYNFAEKKLTRTATFPWLVSHFFLAPIVDADEKRNQLQGLVFHIFPKAFFTNIGKPTFCLATIFRPGKIFGKSFSGILRFASK